MTIKELMRKPTKSEKQHEALQRIAALFREMEASGVFDQEEEIAPPSTIKTLMHEAHETAVANGWYEKGYRSTDEGGNFAKFLCNVQSELSEVWEAHRNGIDERVIFFEEPSIDNGFKVVLEGIPIELADILIWIFDACEHYGIDLERAVQLKMVYNKARPIRHDKKRI